jgi:YHS domain-containing protein
MLAWVIRLLLLALVLRAVSSFINGLRKGVLGRGQGQVPRPDRPRKSMSLVRDPVCGTYIEPSHAPSSSAGGTVHYFCSEDCRQTFRQRA